MRYFWNSTGALSGSTEKLAATSADMLKPFLSWKLNSSLVAFCSVEERVQV